MAMYQEKTLTLFQGVGLLLLCFLVFYCPWQLGGRELYRHEGMLAAQTIEAEPYLLPVAMAHGVVIKDSPPLYPWLASWLYRAGVPMEYALRVWPLISLAALAVLAFLAARAAAGNTAGFAAAAVAIGGNLMLEKAIEASPLTVALPLMLAGQLAWFYFGYLKSSWLKGWVLFGVFTALAFYLTGIMALWYMILPMVFMRRPLSMRRRHHRPGMAAALGIVLVTLLLWALPHWIHTPRHTAWEFSFDDWDGYWWHLLSFPLDAIFRLLPWSVLAWAPFCVAIQWVSKEKVFCQFLRTIAITSFFILWLNPSTQPRDQLILVGPLAILTGINYALVVRRHGKGLIMIMRWLTPALLLAGIGIIAFFWLPNFAEFIASFGWERSLAYSREWFWQIQGTCYGALVIVAALVILSLRGQIPVWAYMLLLIAGVMCFWWSIATPYRAQLDDKRLIGRLIHDSLPPAPDGALPIIYKYGVSNLYAESYYAGAEIRSIDSYEELPGDERPVFLLTPEFPQYARRAWTRLLPPETIYRGRPLYLLRGDPVQSDPEQWWY